MNTLKQRLKKILYFSPKRIVNSNFLNFLGYQVIRTLFFHSIHFIKSLFHPIKIITPLEKEIYQTLKRDGVCVVQNFLPLDLFNEVKHEFSNSEFQVSSLTNVPCIQKAKIKDHSLTNKLYPFIGNNSPLTKAILGLIGGSWNLGPLPSCGFRNEFIVHLNDVSKPHLDGQDIFHYDVPFHSYKALLYLNKVTKENGAFRYVKGSHPLSPKRIKLEYIYSLNYYKKRRIRNDLHPEIDETLVREIGGKWIESLEGEPNTLIIFDVMGLHARGTFSSLTPRETLSVDYRMTDSPINLLRGLVPKR